MVTHAILNISCVQFIAYSTFRCGNVIREKFPSRLWHNFTLIRVRERYSQIVGLILAINRHLTFVMVVSTILSFLETSARLNCCDNNKKKKTVKPQGTSHFQQLSIQHVTTYITMNINQAQDCFILCARNLSRAFSLNFQRKSSRSSSSFLWTSLISILLCHTFLEFNMH